MSPDVVDNPQENESSRVPRLLEWTLAIAVFALAFGIAHGLGLDSALAVGLAWGIGTYAIAALRGLTARPRNIKPLLRGLTGLAILAITFGVLRALGVGTYLAAGVGVFAMVFAAHVRDLVEDPTIGKRWWIESAFYVLFFGLLAFGAYHYDI